jgi:hypothetical protein
MAQTAGTTNMEILRQKIKADKKLVAQNLELTDAEGTTFWPVAQDPGRTPRDEGGTLRDADDVCITPEGEAPR